MKIVNWLSPEKTKVATFFTHRGQQKYPHGKNVHRMMFIGYKFNLLVRIEMDAGGFDAFNDPCNAQAHVRHIQRISDHSILHQQIRTQFIRIRFLFVLEASVLLQILQHLDQLLSISVIPQCFCRLCCVECLHVNTIFALTICQTLSAPTIQYTMVRAQKVSRLEHFFTRMRIDQIVSVFFFGQHKDGVGVWNGKAQHQIRAKDKK